MYPGVQYFQMPSLNRTCIFFEFGTSRLNLNIFVLVDLNKNVFESSLYIYDKITFTHSCFSLFCIIDLVLDNKSWVSLKSLCTLVYNVFMSPLWISHIYFFREEKDKMIWRMKSIIFVTWDTFLFLDTLLERIWVWYFMVSGSWNGLVSCNGDGITCWISTWNFNWHVSWIGNC